MNMIQLHGRALRRATEVIVEVRSADLTRATPCAGWDLHELLAHCIGQNHGFADAVAGLDAPTSAFAPRPPAPGTWEVSAERVHAAFRAADPDRLVRLVEFGPEARFPVASALGFHLLDTVVHTWDVATSLELPFRPDDDLLVAVANAAWQVPTGAARERPGAAFGPVLAVVDADPWAATLAQLGRAALLLEA
ncbi:MAG: TIGR03086 family protein [Pseudonocardiales bacterium]|nr:TIGR03086 family protein [Pseudonocardiales bacterium]